jgi:hypothetical protein
VTALAKHGFAAMAAAGGVVTLDLLRAQQEPSPPAARPAPSATPPTPAAGSERDDA